MKKSKNIGLKRLLVITLVFALAIGGSTLTAFASTETELMLEAEAEVETEVETEIEAEVETETEVEAEDDTIVIFDEDGTVTYRTITTQGKVSADSEDVIIVDNSDISTCAKFEGDDTISPLAASGLVSIPESSVTQNPYPYCCLILSTFPSGEVIGSSGILLGKNLVLASGHGVYDHNEGGEAKSILVGVGAYYTSTGKCEYQLGIAAKKQMILHQNWVSNKKATADWSLIILDTQYDLGTYPKYGYAADYKAVVDRPFTLIGYPKDRFCFSKGEVEKATDEGMWETSAASERGMSGGPMIDEGTGAIIGVEKGRTSLLFGKNLCTPITEQLNNLIMEYKYK